MKNFIMPGIVSFLSFFIYLKTLAPTVAFLDTGEMIASSYTLGISHPPGYPLYCLFGKFFSYIFFLGNIGFRYNLISAIAAAATTAILTLTIQNFFGDKKIKLCIFSATMLLALSKTFWLQATLAEKYSINALFASVLFYLAVKLNTQLSQKNTKILYIFFFIFTLSLAHHLQTIYFLPTAIILLLINQKRIISFIKLLPILSLPLLLYIYLPLRTLQLPQLCWGKPDKLSYFIDHISAKQYKTYFIEAQKQGPFKRAVAHLKIFADELLYIPLIFAALAVFILRKNLKLLIIILSIIFMNLFYASRYDIPNIRDYYLPSHIVLTFLIALGFVKLKEKIKVAGYILCIVFIIFSFIFSIGVNQRRYYYFGYDFGRNILRELEPNSIFFSESDDISFPLWYLQYIEGRKEKVMLISINFLQYDWYVDYLKERQVKISTDKAILELEPKARTKKLVDSIISNYIKTKSIYSCDEYTSDYVRLPICLVYKIIAKEGNIDIKQMPKYWQLWLHHLPRKTVSDYRAQVSLKNYAVGYTIRGGYLYNSKDYHGALIEFTEALKYDTNCLDAHYGIGLCAEKLKDRDKARAHFKKILQVDPKYPYANKIRQKLLSL